MLNAQFKITQDSLSKVCPLIELTLFTEKK